MEVVYARNNQQVTVCTDCHSGLTIPSTAWDVVGIKRESKWMPKLESRSHRTLDFGPTFVDCSFRSVVRHTLRSFVYS